MKKDKLAIHGGSPIRSEPFDPYNTIGKEEIDSANEDKIDKNNRANKSLFLLESK